MVATRGGLRRLAVLVAVATVAVLAVGAQAASANVIEICKSSANGMSSRAFQYSITGGASVTVNGGRCSGPITVTAAQVAITEGQSNPATDVYAVTVRLPDGRWQRGVANIGRRPTVNEGPESRLEVNIFDFDADIYDAELSVALHAYIREERRFPGLDALKAQIATDAAEARRLLAAAL